MNAYLLNIDGKNFNYYSYFKFNNEYKKNNDIIIYIPDKNIPIFPPLKISFKPLKNKK